MKIVNAIAMISVSSLISACAPTVLNDAYWQDTHKKVAIKVDMAPKAVIFEQDPRNTIETAIKAKLNPQLASELKNENGQWLNALAVKFQNQLRQRGIDSRFLGSDANTNGYDQLLILKINSYGAYKFSFTKPEAYVDVQGKLIEIKSKKVLWSYSPRERKGCHVLMDLMVKANFINELHCSEHLAGAELQGAFFKK